MNNPRELEKDVAKILRRFGYNTSEARQQSAEQALRDLGPEIIPVLLKEFGGDDKRGFRVVQAFGALGASAWSAVPELEKLLPSNPDYVAAALGAIGFPALPAIQRGLMHKDPLVRSRTATALSTLAKRERLPDEVVNDVIPMLVEQLKHPYEHVAEAAASALGEIGAKPEVCVAALLSVLERGGVFSRAAFAFAKFGDAGRVVVPHLIEAASSDDEQIRFVALRALGWQWGSDERVVPVLVRHIKDSSRSIRQDVACNLGKRCNRPELAIPALVEYLRDLQTDYTGTWQAAHSLRTWGPTAKEAAPVLAGLLDCPPRAATKAIKDALESIDAGFTASPTLQERLAAADEWFRQQREAENRKKETKSRYGKAKANCDITLRDLRRHPIWLWCVSLGLPNEEDGPLGGDETWMRPLLGSTDVTADMSQPLLLLKVKETKYWASALYDHEKQQLNAISVFVGKDSVSSQCVSALPRQAVYKSLATIVGREELEFQGDPADPNTAYLISDREAV